VIGGVHAANIALIGFMATGKTSVGRSLSARTGLPFQDVDELIEAAERMSVSEIFAARGEAYFRDRESAVFRRLCGGTGQIIGCGGGTLIDPQNMLILRSRCFAVWLRTSAEEILRRIEGPAAPPRPLIPEGDSVSAVTKLLRGREGLYQGADLVVDTDGRTVEEISDQIRLQLALPLREDRCG
jgi:shikimate kinase